MTAASDKSSTDARRCRGERGTALVTALVLLFAFTAGGVIWLARDVNQRVSNRSAAQSIAFQAARSGAQQVEVASLRDGGPTELVIDEPLAREQALRIASRLFAEYDVDGAVLRISSGANLGLDGDALVQFGKGSGLEVAGRLTASGNRAGNVIFTSLVDDAAAGDTNRDGDHSSPSKGDWRGIDVESGGFVSFTSVELRHGDDGMRVFPGGGTVLFETEIHANSGRGLSLGINTTAVVQDSLFHDNDTGIQVNDTNNVAIGLVPGNSPPGGGNSFHCNATFDIENNSGFVLQAYRNYWGSIPPDDSRFFGGVDTGEYLIEAPAAALSRGCLALGREAGTDLRFDWSEMSSCARYQLTSSERPDGVFGSFTTPTTFETHLEPGAATPSGLPTRYFRLTSDFEGNLTLP